MSRTRFQKRSHQYQELYPYD